MMPVFPSALARRMSAVVRTGVIRSELSANQRFHCAMLRIVSTNPSQVEPQKAPGELDHAAADPGVAGSGEALFPPLRTALVRRARQTGPRVRPLAGPRTGSTRHRFAVTHWSRQHLMDEHISRFKADADDPSHLPDHGVRPGFRLLLQSFLTRLPRSP